MSEGTGGSTGEGASEDAPPRSPDPLERAADSALAVLSSAPPLALLAVLAALVELGLARAAWHGLNEILPAGDIIELRRWARFPRNLAAVAGLVALTTSLVSFLRLSGFAPIGRRLAVAAFSGIFVPSVLVAAVLPPAFLRRKLVVFALAAANVLVTLLALTAVRYRPEAALRAAVALTSFTAFLTLSVVGLGQLSQAEGGFWEAVGAVLSENPDGAQRVLLAMRHTAELCWAGVLVCGAVAATWDKGVPNVRARVGGVVALAIAIAVGIAWLQQATGHRFRFLLFGSFRLGLLVDDLPIAYAMPLAIGLAGGLAALVRRDTTMRQLGAGMLLWLSAGFAPHTPIQLLYFVLGAVLLTRAAQARDPGGAWRRRQPWARWATPGPDREGEP